MGLLVVVAALSYRMTVPLEVVAQSIPKRFPADDLTLAVAAKFL